MFFSNLKHHSNFCKFVPLRLCDCIATTTTFNTPMPKVDATSDDWVNFGSVLNINYCKLKPI